MPIYTIIRRQNEAILVRSFGLQSERATCEISFVYAGFGVTGQSEDYLCQVLQMHMQRFAKRESPSTPKMSNCQIRGDQKFKFPFFSCDICLRNGRTFE